MAIRDKSVELLREEDARRREWMAIGRRRSKLTIAAVATETGGNLFPIVQSIDATAELSD